MGNNIPKPGHSSRRISIPRFTRPVVGIHIWIFSPYSKFTKRPDPFKFNDGYQKIKLIFITRSELTYKSTQPSKIYAMAAVSGSSMDIFIAQVPNCTEKSHLNSVSSHDSESICSARVCNSILENFISKMKI